MSIVSGKRVLFVARAPRLRQDGRSLGIGDIVRLLPVIPLLGADCVDWCSDPDLYPLLDGCTFFDHVLDDHALPDAVGDYDAVISLEKCRLERAHWEFSIWSLLDNGRPQKEETYDLTTMFMKALEVTGVPEFPVVKQRQACDLDVGFNTEVPGAWDIKRWPFDRWSAVRVLLEPEYSVGFQPVRAGLGEYVGWVRRCRLLVSVVGLGSHLAMHFGIPVVLLSGPTDFAEHRDNALFISLYPESPCEFRACYEENGVNGCGGCMQYIQPSQVAESVRGLLNPVATGFVGDRE